MKPLRILTVLMSCVLVCVNNEPFPTQLQNLLITLQQNPSLVQHIRSNPHLVKTLQQSLLQQQQKSLKIQQPEPLDQCSKLRKQNARLKQMIQAVIDGSEHDGQLGEPNQSNNHYLNEAFGKRRQRELGAPHFLLNKVLDVTKTSLQSILVTPTPSWTTSLHTSSYVTLVTQDISTEVPIIVRGNRIVTTIVEPTVLQVTATEIHTSSILITPTPTWKTMTVTITSTIEPPKPSKIPSHNWPPRIEPSRPETSGLEYADVIELGRKTNQNDARSKLDRLKQAYGVFFANSAQRTAQKNGHIFGSNRNNPIFKEEINDYDYFEQDFDQQGLAAQANPIFVKNDIVLPTLNQRGPSKEPDESSSSPSPTSTVSPRPSMTESVKILTLYFSGKVPGEYTTSLSTVTLDSSEISSVENEKKDQIRRYRYKRDAIEPTKPFTITMTKPPTEALRVCQNLELGELAPVVEIKSSIVETVTKTVTITETEVLFSSSSPLQNTLI